MYNFDQIINRRGTDCVKYDNIISSGRPENTIPLFIADMDFAVAPEIVDALHKAVDRQIYGYPIRGKEYFEAIAGWFARRYDWVIQEEWLLTTPGVVHALNLAVRAYTEPGDRVLLLTPVYGPFGSAVKKNGRVLVDCPLVYGDGRYTVDFAAFEEAIVREGVKLFLLCSPHNPIGRVWTKDELTRMGEICLAHGVTVVADEIHSDFVYPGHKHINFAAISPEFAANSVTCTAPSKTFNLAGLWNSNILISSPELRAKFEAEMAHSDTPVPTIFAFEACKAAYNHGEAWLEELLCYLQGNMQLVRDYFADHLPEVKFAETEGTYLMWGDFSAYGSPEELEKKFFDGGIWMNRDADFNASPAGFYRINVATPRAVLQEAIERMKEILTK
ncbi:MAG: pyridoxal phosphate-dependent aminotransferase [Clostridia bacterium]|nr:pyridoxal phosphate-dependent aminotransferase [Clostridia bacterium]